MVYITVRQSPIYHQMTLEEYLFQNYQTPPVVNANIANTRTYEVENVSEHFSSKIGVEALIGKLVRFNNDTAELRAKERSELYETFYIPKKSGGLRRIDAPKAELMDALRRLKTIFEDDFHAKDWVKVLICIVVSIVSIALIILTMIMPIVWSIKLHNPAFLLLWCIPAGIFVGVWAYQEFFDF